MFRSRKSAFVKEHLGDLLKHDEGVQAHFRDADGKVMGRENPLYAERKAALETALGQAYDAKAQRYEKRSFWQKYVAKPLRAMGTAAYLAVPALIFAPTVALAAAPFYAMLAGAGARTLADVVDAYSYTKQRQISATQAVTGLAEGVATRYLGFTYEPMGGGLVDFLRGGKFERKMKKHLRPVINETVDYAKQLFMQEVATEHRDGLRVMPLKHFRRHRQPQPAAAAA